MNHVELSGLIAEPVVAHKVNEQIVHAEFQLQTRHKNRAGEWQKERTYTNNNMEKERNIFRPVPKI